MSYRIKNWDRHYETNDTRKLVSLHWVKVPNQQDSLAYRLIAAHKRGAEIFAAWVLILQVASKGRKEERGNLPLSPEELGIVTGFPADIFELAIDFLKSPKIGWIEQSTDNLPLSPETPGEPPANPPLKEGRKEQKEYIPAGEKPSQETINAIFDAYPSHRTIKGKTSPVGKTLNDYNLIAQTLKSHPTYPLLEAVTLYAKGTDAPKDLRSFLAALPDMAALLASSVPISTDNRPRHPSAAEIQAERGF